MRVPLVAFLVLFLIKSLIAAVEKPFNFNETPGKLPKEVVPTEYAIRIVPNLDNFAFAGSESVKLNVRSPVHQLVLNGARTQDRSGLCRWQRTAALGD